MHFATGASIWLEQDLARLQTSDEKCWNIQVMKHKWWNIQVMKHTSDETYKWWNIQVMKHFIAETHPTAWLPAFEKKIQSWYK